VLVAKKRFLLKLFQTHMNACGAVIALNKSLLTSEPNDPKSDDLLNQQVAILVRNEQDPCWPVYMKNKAQQGAPKARHRNQCDFQTFSAARAKIFPRNRHNQHPPKKFSHRKE
jgi:hypothetical protein